MDIEQCHTSVSGVRELRLKKYVRGITAHVVSPSYAVVFGVLSWKILFVPLQLKQLHYIHVGSFPTKKTGVIYNLYALM